MKTLIAIAALAATLTATVIPAMASADTYARVALVSQDRGNDRYDRDDRNDRRDFDRGGRWDDRQGGSVERRIDMLQDRIDSGRRYGSLSGREAVRLNANLRDIVSTKRSFERSGRGLDGREVNILNNRLDNLSAQLHFERNDRNRW